MKVLKKAELRLWVYGGDIQNAPATPDYILTKTKLSTEDTIVFEVAELIKDFVEVKFDGDYNTLVQSKWVKWRVERTYEDTATDTDGDGVGNLTTNAESFHAIAFRGYGENVDGINPELSKTLLMSNRVINNRCGDSLTVPIYSDNSEGVVEVNYYQDAVEIDESFFGVADIFTIAQSLHINPELDDIITIDKTANTALNPDNNINSSLIPPYATEFSYLTRNGERREIPIDCIAECDQPHHKVSFINKFGVMQDMWFFARKTDSISSKRENYKRTKLNTIGGLSYNKSSHQNVYLENQGKERFTMNTGFIHESYNEVIKQLLVSEYVYMYDTNTLNPTSGIGFLAVPVTVASSDVSFKTRLNDKLVEYTLEFEADSDFIQSVR